MGWVDDVALDGEICTGVSLSNLKKTHHMEEQGVDGILKWILYSMGVDWFNLTPRYGQVTCSCENCEPPGCIKYKTFLDWLKDVQLSRLIITT